MAQHPIRGLRQFVRIPFSAPVQLVVHSLPYSVQLIDLALKGALVQCDTDCLFQLNDPCRLVLPMSGNGDGITMVGRIAHLQDPACVGIECTQMDLTSLTRLRRLLELNLGDPQLMHREIQALFHSR